MKKANSLIINNQIRPSVEFSDLRHLIKRLTKTGITVNARINFAGWVRRIDIDSSAITNDFRVLHHMERYWFAKDYLKQQNLNKISVLDVGIGEGHGMKEFLKGFSNKIVKKTVGVDVDKEISQLAKKSVRGLEVINANIKDVNLSNIFNVIFCFELMGNRSLESDNELLKNLDKLCSSGGYIFLSIAAFGNTQAGKTRIKNYSARIYDSKKFINLVSKNFKLYELKYFGQIYPLKRINKNQMGIWENPNLEKDTDFLICVAKKY